MQKNKTFQLTTLAINIYNHFTHRVVAHHPVLQRVVHAAPVAEEVPGDLHDGEDGPLAADLVHDVLHPPRGAAAAHPVARHHAVHAAPRRARRRAPVRRGLAARVVEAAGADIAPGGGGGAGRAVAGEGVAVQHRPGQGRHAAVTHDGHPANTHDNIKSMMLSTDLAAAVSSAATTLLTSHQPWSPTPPCWGRGHTQARGSDEAE